MISSAELTAEVLSSFLAAPPEVPGQLSARLAPPVSGAPVLIPPAPAGDRDDLLTTLRRRRSLRSFTDASLAPATVLDIIRAGLLADRETWPDEQDQVPLETIVVALRLSGLAPAVYLVDSAGRELSPVLALAGPEDVASMTLQREFAAAAAIVAFTVDLESCVARHGGHGYRLLLCRVGAAAYTMWLDAVARGLVGTVFAGFLPAAVRRPLRCDGGSRQQAFALALGTSVGDQSREAAPGNPTPYSQNPSAPEGR